MKKIFTLLYFFAVWQSKLSAQIYTVNCSLGSSFVQEYGEYATRLALREIYTGSTNYTDSIIIPQSIYLPILKDLSAISHTQTPPADSVFNLYDIHTFPTPYFEHFSLGLDTNQQWVKNWFAGNILSGKDSIDALMNSYNLIFGGMSFWSNICQCEYVDILTAYPLNINALADNLKKLRVLKQDLVKGCVVAGAIF